MTETILQIAIKHEKELPKGLVHALEAKAYDWCNSRGVLIDVEAKAWYVLEVKEARQ